MMNQIRTIADIIDLFRTSENARLKEYNLQHRPSIGDMYEGLTKEILEKTLPSGLNLQIVDGFIIDADGNNSPQIDCMLVKRIEEKIPYSLTSVKCKIEDVVAIIEVKKNMHKAELSEAYLHFSFVNDFMGKAGIKVDKSFLRRAFFRITGKKVESQSDVEALPEAYQYLWHAFVVTYASPLKIILGYNGFASEQNLRDGFVEFLKEKGTSGAKGFGWASFPHLIVDDMYSLLLTNGFPYSYTTLDERCCVYASSKTNPIVHLIEFLWTKLTISEGISLIYDQDLKEENIAPFLWARFVKNGSQLGWAYDYDTLTPEMEKRSDYIEWQPTEIDLNQHTLITELCKDGKLALNGDFFQSCVKESGVSQSEFIDDLRSKGLITVVGNDVVLTTEFCSCGMTPDGKFWCGENSDGKFSRWLISQISKKGCFDDKDEK
jgi:hypothetical protein